MKRKLQSIAYLLMTAMLVASCGGKKQTSEPPDWARTDFQHSGDINPTVSPDTTTFSYCPMRQDSVAQEASDTFNPATAVYNGRVVVLHRAEDSSATNIGLRISRLGCASSDDGLHFRRVFVPVLYPADDSQKELENPGGCEDPRVTVTEGGPCVMHYTQWNREQARLAVITSRDLQAWEKHGPVFVETYNGRFVDEFSKFASIVTELAGDRYWTCWGERFVNVATFTDLVNWEPMLDENGGFLKVMTPHAGKFDSDLTECGPPAILTNKGILLFYNGENKSGAEGDTLYTVNSYCAEQALFDARNPIRLIGRLDKPFYIPESDFEKSGQYPAGTVFIEEPVSYNQKWPSYYGCTDLRVVVAAYDPLKK